MGTGGGRLDFKLCFAFLFFSNYFQENFPETVRSESKGGMLSEREREREIGMKLRKGKISHG